MPEDPGLRFLLGYMPEPDLNEFTRLFISDPLLDDDFNLKMEKLGELLFYPAIHAVGCATTCSTHKLGRKVENYYLIEAHRQYTCT